MKLYLTELIRITTPGENIIALDNLRRKYGEHKRDHKGSYFDVDDEVMQCLPKGTSAFALPQGQEES
jgi:hypothetical protein